MWKSSLLVGGETSGREVTLEEGKVGDSLVGSDVGKRLREGEKFTVSFPSLLRGKGYDGDLHLGESKRREICCWHG